MSGEQTKSVNRVGRFAAVAGAAVVTAIAVLGPNGSPSVDAEKVTPVETSTVFTDGQAAKEAIRNGEAVGDKAVYVVQEGDTASEIAEKVGSSEAEDQIIAQNGGSTLIREEQRFVLPAVELDPTKTDLVTTEAPAETGINAQGEVAPMGPDQTMQMVEIAPDSNK